MKYLIFKAIAVSFLLAVSSAFSDDLPDVLTPSEFESDCLENVFFEQEIGSYQKKVEEISVNGMGLDAQDLIFDVFKETFSEGSLCLQYIFLEQRALLSVHERDWPAVDFFLKSLSNVIGSRERNEKIVDDTIARAMHVYHTILGIRALDEKNLIKADNQLKLSAISANSDYYMFADPYMEVAYALLKLGQREAVILYLETFKNVRYLDSEKFQGWIDEIKLNKVPDGMTPKYLGYGGEGLFGVASEVK